MAKNIIIGGTTYSNTTYVRFATAEGNTATFVDETRDTNYRITTSFTGQGIGGLTTASVNLAVVMGVVNTSLTHN